MYKITLYDQCCSPICDGTTFWFVEDLEEFEKHWVPLAIKMNTSQVDRYYRSKFGEIITDYYSNDESLNIVQKVDSEVLEEKVFEYLDREVELINTYNFTSKILFDKLKIILRVLRCNEEIYLVGQYEGYGCCRVEPNYNRWYDVEVNYSQMHFFGNPIAKYKARDINWDDWGKDDAYKDFYTNDKDFYKNEQVKTFVWIPIKEVDLFYKIKELSDDETALLLRDIVGETG